LTFFSISLYQTVLLKALESLSTSAIAEAVFSIRLSRAKDEVEEARKIALRRSGTRGSEARKRLLKAEAVVAEYEQRLAVPISAVVYTSNDQYHKTFQC